MNADKVNLLVELSFYVGLAAGILLITLVNWLAGILGRFIARKVSE